MALTDALLLDPYSFEAWIAYRSDGIKGSGTANDPWDGSTAAKFDARMGEMPPNTCVHLGPSPRDGSGVVIPFQTKGYSDDVATGGWQAKPGLRIVGSGMDVTTLQLTNTGTTNARYFAIGHALSSGGLANPVDHFEVSDLTVDCNLTGTAQVACGAIRVMGSNAKIQRVRAIKWGNNISAANNKLGFVFAVIAGDPDTNASASNAGMENCMAVDPAQTGSTTFSDVLIFHAGGKDHDTTQKEAYGLGLHIRNCVVDGGQLGNGTDFRSKFRALSMCSCRASVVEGNHILNLWIGGPHNAKWSARDVVVRNNYFKNVVKGLSWSLGTLGSSLTLNSLVRADADPATTKTAEATTSSNHPLVKGDRVKVSNASQALFNGVFVVTEVPANNKFRYEMVSRPTADSTSGASAQKVVGLDKLIGDGNVIELANTSGLPETPIALYFTASATPSVPVAFVYGDVILRRNVIRYLDGTFDAAFTGYAMDVKGAQNFHALDNIVECAPTNPMRIGSSGAVTYFNNKTPGGVLVQGWNNDISRKYDELETEAEDALVMSMFNER